MKIENFNKILPINELYIAIQCEGSRQGKPTIIIRTVGCPLRCYFGEGGYCDSWMNSYSPESGKFTFNDIIKLYEQNPNITEMMITGGSPTLHPALINSLTIFANEISKKKIKITLETEGSKFVKTKHPIDLISLSPKFKNSIPVLGDIGPNGKPITSKIIKRHNKFRMNIKSMLQTVVFHNDIQLKPVWDGTEEMIDYIETLRIALGIPKNKVWLMPAGDNRKSLIEVYGNTMNKAIEENYNFTGRAHIIAFDKKRYV